jgi:hypothetical protein
VKSDDLYSFLNHAPYYAVGVRVMFTPAPTRKWLRLARVVAGQGCGAVGELLNIYHRLAA